MKATIKSRELQYPVKIASSTTPSRFYSHVKCDGEGDEQVILSEIEKFEEENIGGIIQLLPGTFNFADTVELHDGLKIIGDGESTTNHIGTLINQTASNKPAFDVNNATGAKLKGLTIKMPLADGASGIIASGSKNIYNELYFRDGTPGTWMIDSRSEFNMTMKNIAFSTSGIWKGNGLSFTNPTSPYLTGNSFEISGIGLSLRNNNAIGILVDSTVGSKAVNILGFSGINISTNLSLTGLKGIYLKGASRCSFSGLDIENCSNGIYMEGASENSFKPHYLSNTVNIYEDSVSHDNRLHLEGHISGLPDSVVSEQSDDDLKIRVD